MATKNRNLEREMDPSRGGRSGEKTLPATNTKNEPEENSSEAAKTRRELEQRLRPKPGGNDDLRPVTDPTSKSSTREPRRREQKQ
jgi:hypothetical protein